MREEESTTSNTPAEICFKKLKGIPGNPKGTAAPKQQILLVENLRTEVDKEKKRAAEAEAHSVEADSRAAMLTEKVAAQDEEMNTLKARMQMVLAKLNTTSSQSRYTVSVLETN